MIGGGIKMGIVKSERSLSQSQKKDIISFLRINLVRKLGKEKIEFFLAINKKNFNRVSEYFLFEIKKVFFHTLFPVQIRKADVDRLLKLALNEVQRDYYFSQAMKVAQEAMLSGKDYEEIPDLIYDIMGPELSQKEREMVVQYASFDLKSELRKKKRRQKFNFAR